MLAGSVLRSPQPLTVGPPQPRGVLVKVAGWVTAAAVSGGQCGEGFDGGAGEEAVVAEVADGDDAGAGVLGALVQLLLQCGVAAGYGGGCEAHRCGDEQDQDRGYFRRPRRCCRFADEGAGPHSCTTLSSCDTT